jgi:hypothetical protein
MLQVLESHKLGFQYDIGQCFVRSPPGIMRIFSMTAHFCLETIDEHAADLIQ